jgi:hypothetical protein
MPQLDTLTYISQFVWFLFSFIVLYIYIENIVLPKLALIFKIRIWNILKSDNHKLNNNINKKEIISVSNLNTIENYYNNVDSNSKNWLNNEINDIKINQLYDLNSTYITEVSNYLLMRRNIIESTEKKNDFN